MLKLIKYGRRISGLLVENSVTLSTEIAVSDFSKWTLQTKHKKLDEGTKNTWFNVVANEKARNVKRTHTIRGIIVDAKGQREKCYAEHLNSLKDYEDCEIFYHGTTEVNALNIIKYGIIKEKGGKRVDFSNGDGFYVDHDLDNVLEWVKPRDQARTKSPTRQAVLVYQVKRAEFRNGYQGLNLTSNTDFAFTEVVMHFRNGELDKRLKDDLAKYDFIEGPWSAGPWPRKLKSYSKSRASPLKNSYQLCLKTDCSMLLFTTHLKAVVYFEYESPVVPKSSRKQVNC